MEQALLFTIRFHEGRYHGSDGWPPSPSRLFQALMAGAARGAHIPPAIVEALDWLEKLPQHPAIAAPHTVVGQVHDIWVPNNDLDAKLSEKGASDIDTAMASIRVKKRVRPVLFDVDTPILYCWPISDQVTYAMAICEAAENLYQLGRGLDMAWAGARIVEMADAERQFLNYTGIIFRPSAGNKSGHELLCPCPGSRKSLAERFDGMCRRLIPGSGGSTIFIQPPKAILTKVTYNSPPICLIYQLRETDVKSSFAPWRLSESAQLVTEVRDHLVKRMTDVLPAHRPDIERYIIGRNTTDADKSKRVQIVPIPSVGHPDADMRIRRLAVYVPQACPVPLEDLNWSLAQIIWKNEQDVAVRELQRSTEDSMVNRYEQQGRRWESATPLALQTARSRRIDPDRQDAEAKNGTERAQEENHAIHAVRQALRYAGITARPTNISVQREPFNNRGQRAELFAAGTRFPKEALWHVSIMFSTPVSGPLILGNGRYLGLGLMQPNEPQPGILAFGIQEGLADVTCPLLVARAARRAMIARVNGISNRKSLPTYVTGHEADGSPSQSRVHCHIAIVVDLPRRRFLYISPNWLYRNDIRWQHVSRDHSLVEQALENMRVLLAGQSGRLVITPKTLKVEHDPLFAPARSWESLTDYHVTRHHHRLADAEVLKMDILVELKRRGWPTPRVVEVLAVQRGLRGRLSGRLHITFATSESGPLLLGRTAHAGGGLFAHAKSNNRD